MVSRLNQEDWNAFVQASPDATFLHSWEWGEFQERLNIPYWRMIATRHGRTLATALVIRRELPWGKSWLYLPRGPVFAPGLTVPDQVQAWQDLEEQIKTRARQEQALFAQIDPAWPAARAEIVTARGWVKAEREVQPQDTIVLDLAPTVEELLGHMHAKTRYNIRLAQKQGVTVTFSTHQAALENFLSLAREVQERSGFHYHPEAYYRAMHEALAPGLLEVAEASYRGVSLAAHILITFGDTTTYVHGASSSSHRQLMAPHLLQWESIKRARDRGQKNYDFFGVAPRNADQTHNWSGITRFKEGFGGQRLAFMGTHDYIFDRVGYAGFTVARRLRKLWR